jgi:hypothetical protein
VTVEVVGRWIAEYDPFVKAVVHDGVDIKLIKHFGRYQLAELRTALLLGQPPLFKGAVCTCGCGRRYNLQWDHIDPRAMKGPPVMRTCSR